MQSESRELIFKKNLKTIIILIVSIVMIALLLFRNFSFKSTYLLKSFGELSVDPEIAFKIISLHFWNFMPSGVKFAKKWRHKFLHSKMNMKKI